MGTFFITGSTGGIGTETAIALAREGHRLLLGARSGQFLGRKDLGRLSKLVQDPAVQHQAFNDTLAVLDEISGLPWLLPVGNTA